jgi:pentatricopeptide repeat protein
MQHQNKDLTQSLDAGSDINPDMNSDCRQLQASQPMHWEIVTAILMAASSFCVWQSAELLLVMIGVPLGAWVLQPSSVTDLLNHVKTNTSIMYYLTIWELVIFCVSTQICCVELFVVATAVPLGICALWRLDTNSMKPQIPCDSESEGKTLAEPKKEKSLNAKGAKISDSECEGQQDEEAHDDFEILEELGEAMEAEEENEEGEAKEAGESKEPNTFDDLRIEASADEVKEETAVEEPDEPSPTSKMNWAALSEFSELEELPSGAIEIRPRPKQQSNDNGSRQSIAKATPEHSIADNDDPNYTKKVAKKGNEKGNARNVKGSQQSSRAQLLAFAEGATPASTDDVENEEQDEDERPTHVKKYRKSLALAFQNGDYYSAEKWMTSLEKEGVADAVNYNMIMNLCIKKKDGRGAAKWMQRMQDHGVQADTASYNSIIHSSAQAGDVRGAEKWLDQMRSAGMQPNKITLNAVISACAQACDQERAQYWMGQFGKEGLSADVVSFGAMINACAKRGDPKGAAEWLEMMLQFGVEPNNVTYGAVITACARAGDRKAAEQWFKKMCDDGIEPDRVCFNILIDTCAKAKDPDAAEAYLDQMIASGTKPDTRTYNAMMNACAKGRDSVRAERLLGEMVDSGIPADVISYSTVINACASTGQVSNAAKWLTQMLKEGIAANVQSYSTVVSAFARKGNVKGAEQWLMRMKDAGVKGDTIAYTAVINACGTVGDVEKAEQWLVTMLEEGVEPNVVSFNAVIAACVKSNNGEKALEWLDKMRACDVPPNSFSYNLAVKPFVVRGDIKNVERLFNIAQKQDRLPWDDFVLASLIRVYGNARQKQPAKAEEAFYDAVQNGVRPSNTTMNALISLVGKQKADVMLKYAKEQNKDRWDQEDRWEQDQKYEKQDKGKGKGKSRNKGKGKIMDGLMPKSPYQ